jgi:hypothetical protein
MAVATNGVFVRIEELADYWVGRLDDESDFLGFKFVGGYDEPLTTAFPAVHISTGTTNKEVHATHMYLVQYELEFTILHAQADEDHRTRSREMLRLVTDLVNFLESDKTIDGRIIFGYVLRERSGVLTARSRQSEFIVASMITYQATVEVPFE